MTTYFLTGRKSPETYPKSLPTTTHVVGMGLKVPGLEEILAAKQRLGAAINKAEKEAETPEEEPPSFSPRCFSIPFVDSEGEKWMEPYEQDGECKASDREQSDTEESPLLNGETGNEILTYRPFIPLDSRDASVSPSIDIRQESLSPEFDCTNRVVLETQQREIYFDNDIGAYREERAQDYSDFSDLDRGVKVPDAAYVRPVSNDKRMKGMGRRGRKQSFPEPVMTTSQSELDEPMILLQPEPMTYSQEQRHAKSSKSSSSGFRKSPRKRFSRLPQNVSEISDSHSSSSDTENKSPRGIVMGSPNGAFRRYSPMKSSALQSESQMRESQINRTREEDLLKLPARLEDVLLELRNHTDMPESDQAQYLMARGFQPEESPSKSAKDSESALFRPFPVDYYSSLEYNPECLIINGVNQSDNRFNAVRSVNGRGTKLFSETEYENADSDYPFSETESQLLAASPETRFLRSTRLVVPKWSYPAERPADPVTQDDSVIGVSPLLFHRQTNLLSSLDYLGLDPGHEADIDSLASSRCSSRVFFDESAKFPFPQMRRNNGPSDSDYDNSFRPGLWSLPPQQVSDMEIDIFDDKEQSRKELSTATGIQKLTSDIKKSFGEYKLASFSDLGSSD